MDQLIEEWSSQRNGAASGITERNRMGCSTQQENITASGGIEQPKMEQSGQWQHIEICGETEQLAVNGVASGRILWSKIEHSICQHNESICGKI